MCEMLVDGIIKIEVTSTLSEYKPYLSNANSSLCPENGYAMWMYDEMNCDWIIYAKEVYYMLKKWEWIENKPAEFKKSLSNTRELKIELDTN